MKEEEIKLLFEECFVEAIDDDLNLRFTIITGVSRLFKNGRVSEDIYPSKEQLKNSQTASTHYHPTFKVYFYLKEDIPPIKRYSRTERDYVVNKSAVSKFEKFAAKFEPILEYSLEKFVISTDYSISEAKPYFKFVQPVQTDRGAYYQTFVFSFINYNELYEYLPIVIESRLVTKK